MVRKIQVNMSNKSFYSLVVIGVLVLIGFAVAYNSGSPSVMGHSINEIEGMDNYYTKGEVYSKSEVDAMLSVIETGGTGCPVGYTLYEQSSEAAKCYKDGEVISVTKRFYDSIGNDYTSTGWVNYQKCEGRIISGNFQTRATYDPGTKREISSGWVGGTSEAYNMYYTNYKVRCTPNWNGVIIEKWNRYSHTWGAVEETSWGNILQIK